MCHRRTAGVPWCRAHDEPRAPRRGEPRRLQGRNAITAVGVLALQGDIREHAAAFRRCGVDVRTVRFPQDLEGLDAVALPGGESTAMSRLLRQFHLDEPLADALKGGVGCFATCAGAILVAASISDGRPDQHAMGLVDISVQRNGYGRQNESFEAPVQLTDDLRPFPGVFIRAPRILAVGNAAEVVARHGTDPVAVVQGRHLAAAFHPEMTDDLRLHRLFLDRLARSRRSDAA
jgi:5'-phosphate synthase pdxT subunit